MLHDVFDISLHRLVNFDDFVCLGYDDYHNLVYLHVRLFKEFYDLR